MTSTNELHDTAVKIIEEYINEGKPFVLYLRKFDIEVLHGKNEIDRYFIDNYLMSNLPPGINLIEIHDPKDPNTTLFRRVPSLHLPDTTWKAVVEELIERADLIVSECLMLSEGVRYELTSCLRHNKHHQTVLILPPPNSFLKTIDDDELIQTFPRCIWANEFHTRNLLDSFVIADLLERVKDISQLSKEQRMQILDSRERLSRYPITYKGVVEGYCNDALMAELGDQDDEDEKSWHYRFWDYFRANSILGVQYQSGQVKIEEITTMVDCYLKMGYLMLWGKEEDGIIVIQGDIDYASKCAISAYSLASKYRLTFFVAMAENLLAEIDKLKRAIAANRDLVVFRPFTKPIVTKKDSLKREEKDEAAEDASDKFAQKSEENLRRRKGWKEKLVNSRKK